MEAWRGRAGRRATEGPAALRGAAGPPANPEWEGARARGAVQVGLALRVRVALRAKVGMRVRQVLRVKVALRARGAVPGKEEVQEALERAERAGRPARLEMPGARTVQNSA